MRACVRIMERRARLCGLDALIQSRLELVGKGGGSIMTDVTHREDLSTLTTAQLSARFERLRQRLHALDGGAS